MSADEKTVKCVVWDLDQTIWSGVLLEGDELRLNPHIESVLAECDRRGILHSIASRNDPAPALAALRRFGIEHYFLHPQIGWDAKSESLRRIAQELNLGLDAFAFVDDQPYERAEVAHHCPEVRCYAAEAIGDLPARAEFQPRFITDESARRRDLYRIDHARRTAEQQSQDAEAFNCSLGMRFRIAAATIEDLQRIEELIQRTNQLNATGYIYGYEQLRGFLHSPRHLLLVAELEDKFGSYGKIGVALVEKDDTAWTIKLLLMSCRVLSRGVGMLLFNYLINAALHAGKRLRAEFVDTGRNRQMNLTYRFSGLQRIAPLADRGELWEYPSDAPKPLPDYVEVCLGSGLRL